MSRTPPNPEQLLDWATRFARELHGIEPPEPELRERIDHVLWGRKQAWASLVTGVITELELRDLLLAHLDCECAHLSGREWSQFDPADQQRYANDLDALLFAPQGPA